eukprot:m.55828 g.55828  ORF g.55828 m.55828 type:complete len:325 (+) comp6962_c0_seq3:222-1196(+)
MSATAPPHAPPSDAGSQSDDWEMVHEDSPLRGQDAADHTSDAAPAPEAPPASEEADPQPETPGPAADVAPTKPTTSTPASSSSPSSPLSASSPSVRLFNLERFRSSLPADLDRLVFFENPVASGTAAAAVLLLFVLLFVDLGYSHLFLFSFVSKWILVVVSLVAGGAALMQKFQKRERVNVIECVTWGVVGSAIADLALWQCRKFFAPHADKLAKELSKVPPVNTRKLVEQTSATVSNMLTCARDVLFVKSFAKTAKALVSLQVLQLFGQWFSGVGLLFLVIVFSMAFPVTYLHFREPIDRAYGTALAKWRDVVSKVSNRTKQD